MTTTTAHSVTVSHRDGSFYVAPQPELEAALLDGMIAAQRWAGEAISWDEITPRFVKGHKLASGERLVVLWSELPMKEEDALIEWMFEYDN